MSEISDKTFPPIRAERKNGAEPFRYEGRALAQTVLDFWRWSASDLVSNATRGVLAEYIVACALQIPAAMGGVRTEWEAFDLLTAEGMRIEVKSAAYLQSWHHENLSAINFSIRPTRSGAGEREVQLGQLQRAEKLQRAADIYVFCVLRHLEKETLDPLNLDQWEFYVLPSLVLDEKCPAQKSIGLKSLLKLNPQRAGFDELKEAVELAVKKLQ